MSSAFSNRLCTRKQFFQANGMVDITPELYKEVLKYKSQDNSYLTQPIDLASYRYAYKHKAA